MRFVRFGVLVASVLLAGISARALEIETQGYSPGDAPARTAPPKVGHRGVLATGPGCGVVSSTADSGAIWLGHFTGGNVGPLGPIPGGVDWRDIYACFHSRRDCEAWQRDLRSTYRQLEGYRTCLIIRAGATSGGSAGQNGWTSSLRHHESPTDQLWDTRTRDLD